MRLNVFTSLFFKMHIFRFIRFLYFWILIVVAKCTNSSGTSFTLIIMLKKLLLWSMLRCVIVLTVIMNCVWCFTVFVLLFSCETASIILLLYNIAVISIFVSLGATSLSLGGELKKHVHVSLGVSICICVPVDIRRHIGLFL